MVRCTLKKQTGSLSQNNEMSDKRKGVSPAQKAKLIWSQGGNGKAFVKHHTGFRVLAPGSAGEIGFADLVWTQPGSQLYDVAHGKGIVLRERLGAFFLAFFFHTFQAGQRR